MTPRYPVARKVTAASTATLITAFIVGWILQAFPNMNGLAEILTSIVGAIVTAAVAFASGWLTKHSPADAEAARHYDSDA